MQNFPPLSYVAQRFDPFGSFCVVRQVECASTPKTLLFDLNQRDLRDLVGKFSKSQSDYYRDVLIINSKFLPKYESADTLDANNATLVIDGAVSGGKATLEGTGQIEFGGASSAKVTSAANSDAILKLDHQSVGDPSAFTGTVSGLNTGGFIDLTNINFADNPTLSYSSKTHVLTVTDNVSHVTDTIKFVGVVGSFSAQSDGSGGTFISDPPPAATNMVTVSHDQFVFASPLGENGGKATNANVQHNEPIDFPHQGGEFVDLAALMAQAHAEGAHLMAAPDAIDMHHAAALAAHHFSV